MTTLLLALAIGAVGGLRTFTGIAALAWAAHLGRLPVGDTWLAFLSYAYTPWVLSLFALVELVTDQLPATPSRKVPVQFGARVVIGAVSGAAIGAAAGMLVAAAIAGVVGAVVGTLLGAAFRQKLAAAFGRDRPAALIEDAVAIGAAVLIVLALP